jgi:hypothetical protein
MANRFRDLTGLVGDDEDDASSSAQGSLCRPTEAPCPGHCPLGRARRGLAGWGGGLQSAAGVGGIGFGGPVSEARTKDV